MLVRLNRANSSLPLKITLCLILKFVCSQYPVDVDVGLHIQSPLHVLVPGPPSTIGGTRQVHELFV